MSGRHCTVCCDPEKTRRFAEMMADGVSDLAIARELEIGRMAAFRHRTLHVEESVRAVVDIARAHRARAAQAMRDEVLAQAKAVREEEEALAKAQREQAIADLAEDDQIEYLGAKAIVAYMKQMDGHTGRSLVASERAGQHIATAALLGRALQAIETRARLGGHGSYKNSAIDLGVGVGGGRQPFSINIIFSGSGHTETIAGTPTTIEGTSASIIADAQTEDPNE